MGHEELATRIKATVAAIRELAEHDPGASPGELLDELAQLDEAERGLRQVRDSILVQIRRRGTSWNTIASRTQVPATTWRGRHDRYTEEAARS